MTDSGYYSSILDGVLSRAQSDVYEPLLSVEAPVAVADPADELARARAAYATEPVAIEASRVRQTIDLLTDEDYEIISVAVGYEVSRSSRGLTAGFAAETPLPLIALAMAGDRRDGVVPVGTSFTSDYFAAWINPISPAGWNEQMRRVIDYIDYSEQPSGRHSGHHAA